MPYQPPKFIKRLLPKSVQAGMDKSLPADDIWRLALSGDDPMLHHQRHFFGLLPSDPRCRMCNAPFRGPASVVFRALNFTPSSMNPTICNQCLEMNPPGGAEIELTMLFADVRGSTTLAEGMTPSEFTRLLNRFYEVATKVLVQTDALIDKLVGDEVIGLYLPGYAGPDYAEKAIRAAREMLRVTGHGETGGPWAPIGIGVHTGIAYVGRVGSEDTVTDVTALGDAVNTTARLASNAAAGEILVSEAAQQAAGLDVTGLEERALTLKGRSEPVSVRVLREDSEK